MSEDVSIEKDGEKGSTVAIDDKRCHICGREMDAFQKGRGKVYEVIDSSKVKIDVEERGVGSCPEHGVSYSWESVPEFERETCNCQESDCPVCS